MAMFTALAEIIEVLYAKNIVPRQYDEYRDLKGGTSSIIGVLGRDGKPAYVVKMNSPEQTASEAMFLKTYRTISFIPNLHYLDPSNRYLVYPFMPGRSEYKGGKAALLAELVDRVLNHYERAPQSSGFEAIDKREASFWDLDWNRSVIGSHLSEADFLFVTDVFERRNRRVQVIDSEYVLHGDCGMHNFLFDGTTLTGVIDPLPILGQPVFDLVYAFCSSPDDLDFPTLRSALSRLRIGEHLTEQAVWEDVIIGLYSRVSSCIQHHPHDLPEYVQAWKRWREI